MIYLYRYLKRPLSNQTFKYIGFCILMGWEYFEVFLRFIDKHQYQLADLLASVLPRGFFEIESTANILGDLTFGSLGLYIAYYLWLRNKNRE